MEVVDQISVVEHALDKKFLGKYTASGNAARPV